MKRLVFFLAIFLICAPAWAATRTWDGGGADNLASTDNNWSDNTEPVAGDTVVFDATSSKDCTWDLTALMGSINFTGYTGTLTLGAVMSIAGNLTLVSGMTFTPSTYKVLFKGTTAVTLASGGKSFYDLEFSESTGGANCTYTLSDNITVTNDFSTIRSYAASRPVLTINSNSIYVGRHVTIGQFTGTAGTATIEANGTGSQTWTMTAEYKQSNNMKVKNPVIINKASGTLTFSGTNHFEGAFTFTQGTVDFGSATWRYQGSSLTYTAGTLTVSTSNLEFGSTQTIPSGFIAAVGDFYKMTLTEIDATGATPTITLGDDITVTNTFTVKRIADASTPVLVLNDNDLYLQGDITVSTAAISLSGSTNITINGSANQAMSDSGNGFQNNIIINKSGNKLTLSGTIDYKTGTITYTGGTVDVGTSTLNITGSCGLSTNSLSWWNITHGTASTVTLSSDLSISNTLAINSNTTYSGAYNVHAKGDITRDSTARTLSSTNSTLLIDGTTDQNIGATNGLDLRLNTTVNKASGVANIQSTVDFGAANTPTWTQTSAVGTIGWGTQQLHTEGSCSLNAGKVAQLRANSGTATLTGNLTVSKDVIIAGTLAGGSNTLTIDGNFTNNGTFTANTSTLALTTVSADQTIAGSSNTTFYGLTYTGNTALTKGIIFQHGKTYSFAAGGLITIIEPYGGAAITLKTTSADSTTAWTVSPTTTQTIERITVLDNDCSSSGATECSAYKGDISDAQNVNWTDEAPTSPVTTSYAWVG